MTPPAATAAARLRPSASAPLEVEPIVAPEVEPKVIRNYSPPRIRRGRIAEGGGVLRPRERRISGPARRIPAGRVIAEEVASLETATRTSLRATVVDRVELPRISFGGLLRRPSLSVPSPTSVVEAVRTAPDHAVTNYLVASRVWIGVVTALAAGLVFIQVQLLHTNAGIGTNVQKMTSLQRENADLRTTVSGLSSDQRIVAEAQKMGFVEPPVGSTRFTSFRNGDANRALSVLATPATGNGMTDASSTSSQDSSSGDSQASATDATSGPMDSEASYGSGSDGTVQSTSTSSSQSSSSTSGSSAATADGGSSPLSG